MANFIIKQIFSVIILTCLIAIQSQAACLTGDCENGKGIISYEDGTQYTGEFKDGKPNGMGTFVYPKGKTMEAAKPISYGGRTFTRGLPMGEKYVGEVKDGKREGKGTLTYYSKAVYTGEFKDDMLSGKGTMINPNGIKYEGDFENGQPNGIGTAYFPDGKIYHGEIKSNQIEGQGVMTYPDGTVEEGIFEKGKLVTPKEEASSKN